MRNLGERLDFVVVVVVVVAVCVCVGGGVQGVIVCLFDFCTECPIWMVLGPFALSDGQ